jgi:hypothetical protein
LSRSVSIAVRTRSVQLIVRCEEPAEPAATRERALELINAGVAHLVLAAAVCPRPPAQWLAEHIIEPVLTEVRR